MFYVCVCVCTIIWFSFMFVCVLLDLFFALSMCYYYLYMEDLAHWIHEHIALFTLSLFAVSLLLSKSLHALSVQYKDLMPSFMHICVLNTIADRDGEKSEANWFYPYSVVVWMEACSHKNFRTRNCWRRCWRITCD